MKDDFKCITTGRLARSVSKIVFPQVNRDMVRHDVERGLLEAYPNFGDNSWLYIVPNSIPDWLVKKNAPLQKIREVLLDLNINFSAVAA